MCIRDRSEAGEAATLIEDVASELQSVADQWAGPRANVQSVTVTFDGVAVVVDIVGRAAPSVDGLRRNLTAALATYDDGGIADAEVDIFFTPRLLLEPTTTTTTTTQAPDTAVTEDPATPTTAEPVEGN